MLPDPKLSDPLSRLLDLTEQEKTKRGLQHTPREIWQQPATWSTTYARCREHSSELSRVLSRAGIGRAALAPPTVYLLGAGTSDYIGRTLAPLLRCRWGADAWAVPSTTLLTNFDDFHFPGRQYLWISFSRSGDSPEGVALLDRVLQEQPGIQHLVITCNRKGQMAQLCSCHEEKASALILDQAVNDRSLAMTSSFSNMVLAGQCVAQLDDLAEFGDVINRIVEAGRQFLPAAAKAAEAITALGCTRACYVGSGALRGVADESALKVVELSAGKVTSVAETPLGLRHGPLSSVDDQTVVVAFLSSEARRRGYELDLLREIDHKRLGRVRAVVTTRHGDDVSSLVDYRLPLEGASNLPDLYRPVLDVMFGQLIGLFTSLRFGLKPDQPSPNGAINRVVAPIPLYT
jgi:tagatose-6-phosphate ketose/aldose isomerase